MYKDYPSGNVYQILGEASNFVGNWIEQGYQSVKHFVAENKDLFIL